MKSYYIQFENRISEEEVSFLRGAIIALFPDSLLFHNHVNDKFRYSYPLVQYKRHSGCAGILGINEAAEELQRLLSFSELPCMLGKRPTTLMIKSIKTEETTVRHTDVPVYYRISNWLPLNQENYREYQHNLFLADRIQMLEKIFIGNILSFTKGIGVFIEDAIICRMVDIIAQNKIPYKGVNLTSFDIIFQCDILLPEYIGLGKGASINHGCVSYVNM